MSQPRYREQDASVHRRRATRWQSWRASRRIDAPVDLPHTTVRGPVTSRAPARLVAGAGRGQVLDQGSFLQNRWISTTARGVRTGGKWKATVVAAPRRPSSPARRPHPILWGATVAGEGQLARRSCCASRATVGRPSSRRSPAMRRKPPAPRAAWPRPLDAGDVGGQPDGAAPDNHDRSPRWFANPYESPLTQRPEGVSAQRMTNGSPTGAPLDSNQIDLG